MTSSARVESYTINLLDQLTGVSHPGGPSVTYGYDAAGNRVTETVDGDAMVYDRLGDNPAPTLLSDGDATWLHAGGVNLSQIDAAGASYLPPDALGSVRAVTDPSGAVTGTVGYDAFGRLQAAADDLGPFGFTGGQHGSLA